KMEVWDSPNSAGVVIDAVRCAKLALDRGIGGALEGPAAYLMKTPPKQYTDDQARQLVENFIGGSRGAAPEGEALHVAVGGAEVATRWANAWPSSGGGGPGLPRRGASAGGDTLTSSSPLP